MKIILHLVQKEAGREILASCGIKAQGRAEQCHGDRTQACLPLLPEQVAMINARIKAEAA